jgi:hypothetical protein
MLVKITKDPYRPVYDKHYCMVGNTSTILTYLLVTKHIIFSVGCVINIRNGTGEFRDGVVMKESFVILWSCIIITYILHFLGIGTNRTYILRTGFMSMGLTMFCGRLLISRCYRHWFPEYTIIVFKKIVIKIKQLLSFSNKKDETIILGLPNELLNSEMNGSGSGAGSVSSASLSNMIENTNKTIRGITARSFRFSLDAPVYAKTEPNKILLNEMHNVINDEKDVVKFRNIVEKSLLVENLDFILAVDKYRNNCKKDFIEFSKQLNKNMKNNANDCFKQFIEINSASEVNISSFVRSRIVNHLETWIDNKEFLSVDTIQSLLDDDPYHHMNIFEKAYSEISIMLFQNIWIKYISEEIKNSMC